MMDDALRASVWERARGRCEYCRIHQDEYEYQTFHVEHIIAKKHGGTDDPETLCLACSECNWAKGPNLAGLLGGKLFPLFNPRKQNWNRHFRWEQTTLVGKTKTGIVTVQVLNMNNASRVMLRENLLFEGQFPPEG
jgi:HNH endonuclease